MGKPKTFLDEHLFIDGQHEDADPKVLPDGLVTRARNMRVRADGRWACRHDYDAVATTTNQASALRATDLVSYDDRLFAIADSNVTTAIPSTDLYELVNHSQFAWRSTDPDAFSVRLGLVTGLRDIGRPPAQGTQVTVIDCAAAQGLVCLVWETSGASFVHIFRADTDATILLVEVAITRPRVVSIGDTFFIGGISGTAINLFSFDKSTDEVLQVETPIFAAGAAIVHWDFNDNGLDTGAWAVALRTGPTTSVKQLDANGAVTLTFAGPAVGSRAVSIVQTATRVWLVVVRTAFTGELYSYTLAGVLSLGPTSLFGAALLVAQPSIMDQTTTGAETVAVFGEVTGSLTTDVRYEARDITHTFINSATWPETTQATKTVAAPGAKNFIHLFGGKAIDGTGSSAYLGLMQQQFMAAYKDKFAAGIINDQHLPRIALDASTGLYYWPALVKDGDGRQVPVVTELKLCSTGRIQTAQLGGLLYLAGGVPQVFDGRLLAEAGFAETPFIYSAGPTVGAGTVPSNVSLLVAVTWEWRDAKGNFLTSRPSSVTTVPMGATGNQIVIVASVPHSLRKNISSDATASSITLVTWRSVAGINQLRRATTAQVTAFGVPQTVTLTDGDAVVRTGAVIYTQGGRGILSAVEPHESPVACEFIWTMGNRLLTAGGPNRYQAQVSKILFPGEPVEWSNATGFFVRGPETAINGVASLGAIGILCTAQKLYRFSGEGPNDNGENGYEDAVAIEGSVGLKTCFSLVSTPFGLMFQGTDLNLWLLPLDGSPPVPFLQVQDTMVAFPNVTAAVISVDEQVVSFYCMNAAGTDSRIVSLDIDHKAWIVDDFASATPIASAAPFQGRNLFLSAALGPVFQERDSQTPAAFIEHGFTTGDHKTAGGTGWFEHHGTEFIGEILGDVNLRLRFSYDSGQSWVNGKTHLLRVATDPAGSIVRPSWAPLRSKVERFRLDFQAMTPGAASPGLVFNGYANELMGYKGAARKAARLKG